MPVPPTPSATQRRDRVERRRRRGRRGDEQRRGHDGGDEHRPARDRLGRRAGHLVLDQQPRDRVAERGAEHHRAARRARRALPDRSRPNSITTPTIPITMPTSAQPCERSAWSKRMREQRGEDRDARDQDRRQRRGDVVLAVGDEQERHDHLDEGDDDHPPHPRPDVAEHAAARGERQEEERAEGRPQAHDRALGEVVERDLDEHVRRPPDRGVRDEHEPGASGHAREASGARAARQSTSWVRR